MGIKFIDQPRPKVREDYSETLDYLIEKGSQLNGIKGIYQFGTISYPGLSDLDMIFVFETGAKSDFSFMNGLPEKYRYFLTHNVVGITEEQLIEGFRFSFWHNINHLWGKQLNLPQKPLMNEEQADCLKRQIALEYLVTFNLSLFTQHSYGIFKLRSILQQIKGLRYDLEFLHIQDGDLYEMLQQCYRWFNSWFEKGPSNNEFSIWLEQFNQVYQAFILEQLDINRVYCENWRDIQWARHIQVIQSGKYSLNHKGFVIPNILSLDDKKYFNALSRINSFVCHLPITSTAVNSILEERTTYFRSLFDYNKSHIPGFEAMITPFMAYQFAARSV